MTTMQEQWQDYASDMRQLDDGRWIAVIQNLYTWGIVVDMTMYGYAGRYCYETREQASEAIRAWDGHGDPPGPWIKYKGEGGERLGPAAQELQQGSSE